MRILVLMLFVLSSLMANVCDDNKKKIEDKILWQFISMYDEVELCKTLHSMYPQMKANECQVAKATKVKRSEGCELLAGIYSLYGIKVNKNECKYTQTNEYVKDIQNLPNVMRKYVFDMRLANALAAENECIAVSSVKYIYEADEEIIEKIKISLKRLDDDNRSYLKFMESEKLKKSALRIYRFVGDRLLQDFNGYYDKYNNITSEIERYDDAWRLPIEYEVINWDRLERSSRVKQWLDNYQNVYTSNYIVKCYKKSPNDSINIDFKGIKSLFDETITCGELKKKIESF